MSKKLNIITLGKFIEEGQISEEIQSRNNEDALCRRYGWTLEYVRSLAKDDYLWALAYAYAGGHPDTMPELGLGET